MCVTSLAIWKGATTQQLFDVCSGEYCLILNNFHSELTVVLLRHEYPPPPPDICKIKSKSWSLHRNAKELPAKHLLHASAERREIIVKLWIPETVKIRWESSLNLAGRVNWCRETVGFGVVVSSSLEALFVLMSRWRQFVLTAVRYFKAGFSQTQMFVCKALNGWK